MHKSFWDRDALEELLRDVGLEPRCRDDVGTNYVCIATKTVNNT